MHVAEDATETLGCNDRFELAGLRRLLRDRINERWMRSGVTIMDPATTYYENSLVMEGGGPRRELGAGNPIAQFAAQLDGFSEAARTNTPHLTPGEMGLRDIRLIEAMYRSADAGGAVVTL